MELARPALVLVVLAACGGAKRSAPAAHDAGAARTIDAAALDAPVAVPTDEPAADDDRDETDAAAPEPGTVRVTVTWPDAPTEVRASPGYTPCKTPRPPPARIHTLHGVAGVLVTIDAPAGAPAPDAPAVRLTVRDCALTPAIAMARLGASLEVQSQDETARAVTIDHLGVAWAGGKAEAQRLARAQLPALGHTVAVPVDVAGVLRVSLDDVGAQAYVVAPGHGHAAITDELGQVSLARLPAGTYEVTAWLPPDRRVTGKVTVAAGAPAELTLSF